MNPHDLCSQGDPFVNISVKRMSRDRWDIYEKTVTVFPSLAASEREFPLKWGIFEKKRQKNFGDETNMKTFEKNLKIRFIESPYLCAIV